MDLVLVYAYLDETFASGLGDSLAGRGIEVAEPLSLWPGHRLLQRVDARLCGVRYALVIVSADFLKFSWSQKELDGLTTRSKVVSILHGVDEDDVRQHSPRLAVAAIPSGMTEHLVRLVRGQ